MILLLLASGFLAGALGGLLGIGGGILIMPLLRFILGLPPAYAAGTCIVAVFFTTIGGSFRHFKLGHIELRSILPVMLIGLISTMLFSFVFAYVYQKGKWLDWGTGLVFMAVALRMIGEGLAGSRNKEDLDLQDHKGINGSLVTKMSIGGMAGIFPGLLGIGTGAILVPAFSIVLNAPIKIAIGSSLACFSLNSLASSVLKASQGFVDFNLVPPLCLGTIIGAQVGAYINGRFSSPVLKILFGALFVYVASKYLLAF